MLVHREAAELDPAARPKRCDEERYVTKGPMDREHARYQIKVATRIHNVDSSGATNFSDGSYGCMRAPPKSTWA